MILSDADARKVLELRAQNAARCKESFAHFVKQAWKYVNPSPELRWSWHQDVICDHLEALYRGDIRKLIINVPPRSGKSRIVSILYPCWVWLREPNHQFIVATHGDRLVQDLGTQVVKLLQSPFYKLLQPLVDPALNTAKTNVMNGAGGKWFGTTPHGQLTGLGGDTLIFDDLVEPDNADKAECLSACEFIPNTFMQRANLRDKAKFVGIGQRISEQDPYQFCLDRGWFPLVLPVRYEGAPSVRIMPNGDEILQDLRTKIGENLSPVLLTEDYLNELEQLYPRVYAGQYQQRPAPAGGGIIQSAWLEKRWTSLPAHGTWLISVDAAFKGDADSDYVAIGVWVHAGAEFYLVDQIRAKLTFTETCAAIERMAVKYPKAIAKIIEDKANGAAIIDTLGKKMSGVEGVTPEGGKEARLNAVSSCFAAGNVWLPTSFASDPQTTIEQYCHELEVFPGAKNDDQVDQTSQALTWLITRAARMATASSNVMKAMRGEYDPKAAPEAAPAGMGYSAWRQNKLRGRGA
jgi:predicted phage terminase large subunit-like protein